MTVPLVVLSICSVLGGFINLPFHPNFDLLERWLAPVVGASLINHHEGVGALWAFGIVDGALAVTGILLALALWRGVVNRAALEPRFLFLAWLIDTAYDRLIARPSTAFANFAASVLELRVIDGAVNGLASVVRVGGERARRLQTGYVRSYALVLVFGVVVLSAYLLIRVKG